MKRAIILITVLTLGLVGLSLWMDTTQTRTAEAYRARVPVIRDALRAERYDDALLYQSELHALWQHDVGWLNCLVSHHHTRAVNTALTALATALENRWPTEALQALDALDDALGDVQKSDAPLWENIL